MFSRGLIFLCLLGTLWTGSVYALEVPKLTGPVVDLAGVLNQSDQKKIAASLLQFQRDYGPQLQVLVVPKLEDETIEGYSIKVVDEWKLGSEDKDDGVLLLVATQDRKVRIEVGQGLEGDLTDALAGRIIRAGIIPFFKQDQTGAGILIGLSMIAESVGGRLENIPTPKLRKTTRGSSGFSFLLYLGFFLIGPLLFGRRRRGGVASAILGGMLMGSALGGRGGSGGGFSGGGASGSW